MRCAKKVTAASLFALSGVCVLTGTLNAQPVSPKKGEEAGTSNMNKVDQALSPSNMMRRPARQGGGGIEGSNDDCLGAIPMSLGTPVLADTTSASLDAVTACGTSISAPGVWYSIVGDGTTFTADTCGFRDYDTKLTVFCGDCADPVCVTGNDDFCGLGSSVSWCTDSGTTYFILVHGFGGGIGTADLTVNSDFTLCGAPPACSPCVFTCPPVFDAEGEVDCFDFYVDATNGGCNSTPNVFGAISLDGNPVCGTAGTYIGLFDNFTPSNPNDDFIVSFRDTDWYEFTLSGPTAVTMTGSGDMPLLIGLLDMNAGCPNAFSAFATGDPCASLSATALFQPGTYVAFAAPSTFSGVPCGSGYSVAITGVPFTPPTNDTCDTAEAISINSLTSGLTAGATFDGGLPQNCGTNNTAPGVWYTVVGDGTTLTADTCPIGSSSYDTKITVFCGDCATGEFFCVGGNDDAGCGFSGFFGSSVTWCSDINKTYYILVHGFGNATGSFDLALTSDGLACSTPPLCAPCVVPPSGTPEGEVNCFDFYVDATNGGCNSTPEVYGSISCGETVTGTAGTYTGLFDNFTPSNPNDDFIVSFRDTDWYMFTLDTAQEVSLSLNAEFTSLFGVLDFNAGCGGAFFAFNDFGSECAPLTTSGILQAGTYVAFVATDGFDGYDDCNNVYNVTLTCEDPPPPPANDLCSGAEDVAIGSSTPGTTFGTGLDTGADCGSGFVTSPGVWYHVVGNGSTLNASVCNPDRTYDTKLNVFCGSCDNLICIDGVDDSCDGLGSNIVWCSEAGKDYYILVHGFGGQSGGFTLDIIDLGPGCTPVVSCPSAFCAADLSGSSDPNDPAYGVPDGITDSSDFFYYLDMFVANNLAVADISGSSDPNDPGYGVPDGIIDASDFFTYLDFFVACQP